MTRSSGPGTRRQHTQKGGAVVCKAGPSLALTKYWGKRNKRLNLPATTSIAITLKGLETRTHAEISQRPDQVVLDGVQTDPRQFARFFTNLRRQTGIRGNFFVESRNDFPTAAGLASSASGFAALTVACTRAAGRDIPPEELSAIARVGSASAARAVFGGWVILRAGARAAEPLHGPGYWPDLRVIVVAVEKGAKPISSRAAMERVRSTSPYYRSWLRDSEEQTIRALKALESRDLELLGRTMRTSYMRMFATMLAADPPVVYWLPASVRIIQECEQLRAEGLSAWETMDAGPQVKILCQKADVPTVQQRIGRLSGVGSIMIASVGPAPVIESASPKTLQ